MLCHRDAVNFDTLLLGACGPLLEVQRARERRQQHELRESQIGPFGEGHGRLKRVGAIAWQPENERPEHVHAAAPERAEPVDELLAGEIEALVDVLQPFGGDRLDADQGTLDARLPHRIEERRILGSLHRDLREEDRVLRQFGERGHQLEALVPHRLQFAQPCLVLPAPGHRKILDRDRVEVVIGERDEPEAPPPQVDDLGDDAFDGALPRRLSVGPPDRTERAMLGASTHRLHRRPHVPRPRAEGPIGQPRSRRRERGRRRN